jgi:integrase
MASITKVTGGYRARWRTPDGRSRSKNFARKVDAERHLTRVEASKLAGGYVDPSASKTMLRAYAEDWRQAQVWRPLTEVRVESALRNHVYPVLGDRPLGALRTTEIQAWVRQLSERQSSSTVRVNYRLLASVLRAAVRDRILSVSPCDGIRLPGVEKRHVQPLTVEQIDALIERIEDRYRPMVILGAGAGLRLGEALGMGVDQIDFLHRQLVVERQAVTVRNRTTLAAVKTMASRRTIPLAQVVLDELAAHLERFTPGQDGLLVEAPEGGPVPRNRFGEAWVRTVRRVGLPVGTRYHDLRHTYASALIQAGCSVKVVQARLGHTSASVTLDVYSHLWPDDDDRSRAAVEQFLTAGTGSTPGGSMSASADTAVTRQPGKPR